MSSSTPATQAWDIALRDLVHARDPDIDTENIRAAIEALATESPDLRDELMFIISPRLAADMPSDYPWVHTFATLDHSETEDRVRADTLLQLAKDHDSAELQLVAVAAIAQGYGAPHEGILAIKAVESRVLGRLQRAQELHGFDHALLHPLSTLISRNLATLAPIEGAEAPA